MSQAEVRGVVMRGGTSRGVFFHADDLPAERQKWDAIFVDVIGAPDPLQIDGLGGTFSTNSKAMVVWPSDDDAYDVEYLFVQVALDQPAAFYDGNCGNLTSAVGPFAIDEGLVAAVEGTTDVRLHNTNTDRAVTVRVPVVGGKVAVEGDFRIPGVRGSGAPIVSTYEYPTGAVLGKLLGCDASRVVLRVPDVGEVSASIVDVTSPVVFVRANDLGLTAREEPAEANHDAALLRRIELIRATAAVELGLAGSLVEATEKTPVQPKLAVCEPAEAGPGIRARIFSMGRMHHAFTVTGLLCLGAAATIPDTIPFECNRSVRGEGAATTSNSTDRVTISHAKGTVDVGVDLASGPGLPVVRAVSITQTARRLMRGSVYVSSW